MMRAAGGWTVEEGGAEQSPRAVSGAFDSFLRFLLNQPAFGNIDLSWDSQLDLTYVFNTTPP